MNRQELIEQGLDADQKLADPVFLRAIAEMKKRIHAEIVQNVPGDLRSIAACAKLQVLDGFVSELQIIVNDGKMAASRKG